VSQPLDLEPEHFRAVGYEAVDSMTGYYAALEQRPVMPAITAADCEALFTDDTLTPCGERPEDILADWRDRVLPNLAAVGSPRHFTYVNGSGTMMGALAEALAASVNTNAGAWNRCPAATEIERLTL